MKLRENGIRWLSGMPFLWVLFGLSLVALLASGWWAYAQDTDSVDTDAAEPIKPDAESTSEAVNDQESGPEPVPTHVQKQDTDQTQVVPTDNIPVSEEVIAVRETQAQVQEQRQMVSEVKTNLGALEAYLKDRKALERGTLPEDWKLPKYDLYKEEPWSHTPVPYEGWIEPPYWLPPAPPSMHEAMPAAPPQ
jgi:hypothetical protein